VFGIQDKILILGQLNKKTKANTVNKVNKLVTVFALPLHLDNFRVHHKPRLPHLLAILFLHRDNFLAPIYIVGDTAPVLSTYFVTGDNFAAPNQLVPRRGSNSTKLLHDSKNTCHTLLRTPKPWRRCALHRDYFLPKVPGPYPDASSGNTTPTRQPGSSLKQPTGLFINARPYCRAVR
jgi:hypothetical protein